MSGESPDNWVTIELVRIVQELPGVPDWVKGVAGLFGVGAFLLVRSTFAIP